MTEPSNISVLSDGDTQALLPILADVAWIVEDSSWLRLGVLPTIGKRRPAKSSDSRTAHAWEWSW